MAVPKKRTGKSAQATRRANWKASKPEVVVCPNCGEFALAHTVCTACGYYKGKPVSLKDAAAVVEEKKTVKKAAKKAEKVEEKVVETAAEEVKAEVKEEKEEKKTAKKTTKKAEKTEKTEKKTTKKTTKKAEKKAE